MNNDDSNDNSKKQEGSATSLKDLNVSDKKKISNVIHGRKASTYLRIFRDDDGLTEIREAATAANANDDKTIEKLRAQNDDIALRSNCTHPPFLEKRRKSLSLYDTHHKSSTLPKRKFSRSKDNLILTRSDSSSNNDNAVVNQINSEPRSQQDRDGDGLKPTSSATYYPHNSETSPERERQNSIECDDDDDDDDDNKKKKTYADDITAIEAPTVPRLKNVLSDPTVLPSNDYEAIEIDEDYYDDEEEQDTDYPLAVELQPFTNNVGGHTAIFRFSKRAVCKALVNRENKWYENIELTHKELLQFMPRYIGVLNVRQHFHNKEDFLRELSSSTKKKMKENQHVTENGDGALKIGCALKHVHSFPCDTLFLDGQSLQVLPEVVLNDNRHMIPDSLLGIYPNSPSSAPTDSYILSIGKDEDKDYNDKGSNTTNNSNSNSCNNHYNSNNNNNSGSTTVNTKLKELVLQEVFAPTHNASTSSTSRRVNKKSRASSHENSRRGSNQSLKTALSQPATSPLLKKSLKDSISHALNSPSSVMDFKQFQQKEIARENSRAGSQKQTSSPSLSENPSPLLQSNEAISPLSLPIDPSNNSEEGIFDMDDVTRHRLPEPAIASLDNRKHNESVTFEEHSDTIVSKFILLEDLTRKLHKPCALDLKMGTRQYGVDAKRSKQLSQREKCLKTTSRRLGVRICGLKIWNKSYYITRDKYFGRRVKIGWQFTRVLARFIYDGEQISSIVKQIPRLMRQLDTLASEISKLKGYRLYGSSLLLMYDGNNPGNKRCRAKVNLIDFARCVTKDALEQGYDSFRIPPKNPELEDRGFLRGIRSLKFYLMSIWNYLTSDSVLSSDDEELAQLLNENKEKFEQNWDWLDEFDKENEDEFNQPKSELRTKWRKYELIFDLEPRYGDDIDISD